MKIECLVDAPEFWDRLAGDLATARERAWVQTLSFEGDDAGRRLADAMLSCPAADRRILIDNYTRFWLSDRFIYSPAALRDPGLRAEVRATRSMIQGLEAGGVRTRFVSRLGFLFRRLLARDHKKILVIDEDVAYVGGINFSDHNFEWHDLMLRIEHAGVAEFLQRDMLGTWHGHASPARASFDGIELISLDGVDNELRLERVLALMRDAEHSVVVHNAYISFPFCDVLREAATRGVRVTVLTPEANNRRYMWHYMLWESARSGFELRLYPGRMSHLKAVLVDDRWLITGSSNFDWMAWVFQPEIIAVVHQPEAIAEFRAKVLDPDLVLSRPSDATGDKRIARTTDRLMRTLARVGRYVCPAEPRPEPGARLPGEWRPASERG